MTPINQPTSSCPQCGNTVNCNAEFAESKGESCWCMALPKLTTAMTEALNKILPAVDNNNEQRLLTCLCKNCLAKRYNEKIQLLIRHYSTDKLLELAEPYRKPPNLIEHIDYEIENGLYVFSTWNHLKRGKCCNNGCKHCPY